MQTSNHLHNVEHVVQSAFRIMLIIFKHKPYHSHFELTRKRILIKNPNLDFYFIRVCVWGGGGGGGGGGGVVMGG